MWWWKPELLVELVASTLVAMVGMAALIFGVRSVYRSTRRGGYDPSELKAVRALIRWHRLEKRGGAALSLARKYT